MATKLSKEQIQRLNECIKNGTILTTVHNTQYHLILKINAEAICIQSMIADQNDRGLLINLSDVRNAFDETSETDNSAQATGNEEDASCDTGDDL